MIYIISDTHFLHSDIIRESKRKQNSDALTFQNLMKLTSQDTLIHLGDICRPKYQDIAHQKYILPLQCSKILVRGNHDPKTDTWYQVHGWDMVLTSYSLPWAPALGELFPELIFTHMPTDIPNHAINIHGHLHKNMRHKRLALKHADDVHLLFALEIENYRPVPLPEFLEGWQKRSLKHLLKM